MKTSDQIQEIAKALSLAQSQMKPASKDSVNPHFKSKYSDISSIWDAIRGPITSNGLTVWQDVTTEDRQVSITTRIVHVSGQWVEFGPLSIPLSKLDAHGVGSSISYGKRYALCAALGVVSGDEDDDGNHAVQVQKEKAPEPRISIPLIMQSQVKILNERLNSCPQEEQEKFWVKLNQHNVQSLTEIPARWFDGLLKTLPEVKSE